MNEVVQAGPDDWETYREIRLAALADAPDAFGSTLALELERPEAKWRETLTISAVFLGRRDDKVLAIAGGFPKPDGDTELWGVWAHPSTRGTGLAADVIRAVLDWAKDRKQIAAWVGEKNPAAERLYTKLGFRRTGVRGPLPRDANIMEVELMLRLPGAD